MVSVVIDLSSLEVASGVITDSHFGLNFVADYERIGTQPWEKFDDLAAKLEITSTRYPGGTASETVFDYRAPDNTEVKLPNGSTVKLTPLSQYIEYCNKAGIAPTIIIPTACLLTNERIDGQREFDTTQTDDVRLFIESVLSRVDPKLKVSFELGNEYETYMTSTEYGRVANALCKTIGEAYNNLQQSSIGQELIGEPGIFVQSWAYSVAAGLSADQLSERNAQVIEQFDAVNIAAIDGVVSHYYFSEGRNAGTDQAQTFSEIADQIGRIADLHAEWEDAVGRPLVSRISEWNVLFRSMSNLGLQQLNPLMEMFTSSLRCGFDALDFWSAQYHPTSLADASGRLMAAGSLFDVLKPAIVGTQFASSTHGEDISSYTFVGADRMVAVASSTSYDDVTVDIVGSIVPSGYRLVDGYILGVDETTADGSYRDLTDLAPTMEPDARVTTTQLSIAILEGKSSNLVLTAHETVVLIYAIVPDYYQSIYGSDFADLIYANGTRTIYFGGANWDTVNYITSAQAVVADLMKVSYELGYTGDLYSSIEELRGSKFNDKISGTNDGNNLVGREGDDLLVGRGGRDLLGGGDGNDSLYGGSGSDNLMGDQGDDSFWSGGGSDSIQGGAGIDTIFLSDLGDGVTVWLSRGVVEAGSDSIFFSGIESISGSLFADRFSLGTFDATVFGLDGNDSFESGEGGFHRLFGGAGDDTFIFYGGGGIIKAGDGDDKLISYVSGLDFCGGSGDDTCFSFDGGGRFEGGSGDDEFYAYGRSDEFVFDEVSGHDAIAGFEVGIDTISVNGVTMDRMWLESTVDGVKLWFSGSASVVLLGCFDVSLSDVFSNDSISRGVTEDFPMCGLLD